MPGTKKQGKAATAPQITGNREVALKARADAGLPATASDAELVAALQRRGQEAAREVNAAVAAGKLADTPTNRIAWTAAMTRDPTGTRAQLAALVAVRAAGPGAPPASLGRALRASGLKAAQAPRASAPHRVPPVITASERQAANSPADGGAARAGRVSGDERSRRDRVVQAAVDAGKIARHEAASWRIRLDGDPVRVERALANATAGQPVVVEGSLERAMKLVPGAAARRRAA